MKNGVNIRVERSAVTEITLGENDLVFNSLPEGTFGGVYARSGLATKQGLAPANKVGIIDSDYRGEIGAILCNLSNEPFLITKGERIAQMVVCPIVKCNINIVDELDETERGAGRLGSTGMKN